jgi:hypothetical protein
METAACFARKHGLEQYLDKPAELNETILRLLVLQEALHGEQARKAAGARPGDAAIAVRRKAIGAFTVRCSGDQAYRYAVETALKGSTATVALFQRGRFFTLLRQLGVPDERISAFCKSIIVDDNTHCFDPE